MERDGCYLGPFNHGATLRLSPCQNGGWMVSEEVGRDLMSPILGAFTTTDDMLVALTKALCPEAIE